jgi:hypothetical protein
MLSMNSPLDPNDPLVLLFTARLRSQRRWLLAAGAFPALISLPLAYTGEPRLALTVALLVFFVFYQLSCSVVLGKGLVSLGGQANLDELLAANLEPNRLADRAALFSLLRGVFLSPLLLAAMLSTGSASWAALVLLLGLLGQAMITLSIYGSAYHNLFHTGQIPQSELWRCGLRCWLQMMLTSGLGLILGQAIPDVRLFVVPALLMPALMLQQGLEARRALINWMEARRLGKTTQFMSRSKQRPAAFWLWGAEKNPYLYRYHLSRLYWRGRPIWFLACTGFSTLLAMVFALSPHEQRAFIPVLAFYVLVITLMAAVFRQLRDLLSEMQSGNLDLASISLGPQKLVEHLAEVGYRPRLWEMVCLLGPVYLAGLLFETRSALCLTPALLCLVGCVIYQTRLSAYINVLCLFGIRRYSRLDRLLTAASLAQWLSACFACFGSAAIIVGSVSVARAVAQAEPNPCELCAVSLASLCASLFFLTWWAKFIRRAAVRLASNY